MERQEQELFGVISRPSPFLDLHQLLGGWLQGGGRGARDPYVSLQGRQVCHQHSHGGHQVGGDTGEGDRVRFHSEEIYCINILNKCSETND